MKILERAKAALMSLEVHEFIEGTLTQYLRSLTVSDVARHVHKNDGWEELFPGLTAKLRALTIVQRNKHVLNQITYEEVLQIFGRVNPNLLRIVLSDEKASVWLRQLWAQFEIIRSRI